MPSGLGRGLGSLIPNKQQVSTSKTSFNPPKSEKTNLSNADLKDQILQISVNLIEANSAQPRKRFTDSSLDDLASSIKEHGIIQPLIVHKISGQDKYELIAGERRLRAAKKIGMKKVPAIIHEVSNQAKLEIALIENIQRENLNPVELAESYKALMEQFKLTQEVIAKRLGKSRSSVANTLRVLSLPEEIQLALIEGKITEGHAKYLVGLETETKQMNLFRKIVLNGLSVSDTNKTIRGAGGTKASKIRINYRDKDKEFALREFFGSKAEIKRKRKGGQIIIDFYSDDELEELVKKIK